MGYKIFHFLDIFCYAIAYWQFLNIMLEHWVAICGKPFVDLFCISLKTADTQTDLKVVLSFSSDAVRIPCIQITGPCLFSNLMMLFMICQSGISFFPKRFDVDGLSLQVKFVFFYSLLCQNKFILSPIKII